MYLSITQTSLVNTTFFINFLAAALMET